MEEMQEISLLEFAAKAQSKYEVYQFMVNDADLFLPPEKE
jgi:hypothetical protein